MSYILEALKKAERDRQKEMVPDLQTSHTPYPSPPRHYYKKKPLKLIFAFLILLFAAFSLLFLREKPLSTLATQEKDPTQISRPNVLSEKGITEKIFEEKIHNTPPLNDIPTKPGHKIPKKITLEPKPIVLEGKMAPPPIREQVKRSFPTLEELGTTFQAELPELNFAGHTFSETPEERMIIINNRIVREGQNLGNGLRLEEITWDGMIMNYNGTRFSMKAAR